MKTKKPHEETLTVMQFDKERRCLVEGGQRMVAVLRNYEAEDWERLLTAAPDMGRALKELFGEAEHLSTCPALRDSKRACRPDCAQARVALRKAGVLP